MAACNECGDDHVESAARAALAFEEILRLMADPEKKLTPSVMLHVVGLLGALLVHHSEYSYEEVCGEITRVSDNPEVVEGMYKNLVELGLVPAEGDDPAH